jgi:PPOX class probable F420-dependent enzyme
VTSGSIIHAAAIPDSHRDLLERPLTAALTTLLPDGRPQTHPVWFTFTGRHVLVNTMRGFRKERNMRSDPRVTLLVVDPAPRVHWLEVRGTVELDDAWARPHLDVLARRYTGVRHYFGGAVAAELAEREVPVIGRISPRRVVTDVDAAASTARTTVDAGNGRSPDAPRGTHRRPAVIPDSHRDLLRRPLRASLSTLLPSGHPQTQPVWFELDGEVVLVHTIRESRKGRNLLADPRATILVVDPEDTSRWIEIRGDVEVTDDDIERLDGVTRAYTGHSHYYGWIRPTDRRQRETRIVGRITPRRIVCDAIHR